MINRIRFHLLITFKNSGFDIMNAKVLKNCWVILDCSTEQIDNYYQYYFKYVQKYWCRDNKTSLTEVTTTGDVGKLT